MTTDLPPADDVHDRLGAVLRSLADTVVRSGADPARIAQNVYFANPYSKMRLLGTALSNLHRDGELAWMSIGRDDMETTAAGCDIRVWKTEVFG